MSECPDYCRSNQQGREFCRLQRGCVNGDRPTCQMEHSRPLGGNWFIAAGVELGTLFKRNGTPEMRVRCIGCGSESSGIGKVIANRLIARGLTVTWTRSEAPVDTCVVIGCERVDVEYHHFAPRNVFSDADNWPYLPLCVKHHRHWHQTMDGYRWTAKALHLTEGAV